MNHGEVGDDLNALARAAGQPAPNDPPPSKQPSPASPSADADGDALYITAEMDDDDTAAPNDQQAAFETPAQPHAHQPYAHQSYAPQPSYRPVQPRQKKTSDFKAVAAPVLLTVGCMLLVPAFWAVLVLAGAAVPMADREDAPSMAKVMLLCWPLALSLLIPAIFIFINLSNEKKQRRTIAHSRI